LKNLGKWRRLINNIKKLNMEKHINNKVNKLMVLGRWRKMANGVLKEGIRKYVGD